MAHPKSGINGQQLMSSPWLAVPLEDYEGHMNSEGVRQLSALADLFAYALNRCLPASLAVLGVAGGNGLERIDTSITKRTVGIDINQQYLDAVQQRFSNLPGLELQCCDLGRRDSCHLAPVDLVHAALVFEHAGLEIPLTNALSLIAPGGKLSVVLQLPSEREQAVACTAYASMQTLKRDFTLIGETDLQSLLTERGFLLVEQRRHPLPGGKALWLGIFSAQ